MDLGINLWGADWSYDGERMLPTTAEIDYFAAKGFTNIRLPFNWETIQPNLDGALDADFVAQLHQIVDYAASQGVDVILDVHNYGAYDGQLIGSDAVPVSAFADLWGKIASEFADDGNVRFGLMNEPQLNSTEDWLTAANSAIAAIRDAGADQQVLVAGNGWTGSAGWATGENGEVLTTPGAIVDPAQNYAFEQHIYLDDSSGQNDWVVSENIGVERLEEMTDWARANGLTFYLGEFGVADNPESLAALDKMMAYLADNSDVWQSASYWVAGSANPTYMFSVEPELQALDVPQMDVLEKYADASYVETTLADGTVRHDVYAQDGNVVTLSDILSADGELISRSIFDTSGNLSTKAEIASDGSVTVTVYDEAGASYPSTTTVYNADHERIELTTTDASGSSLVQLFEPDAHDPYQESTYAADGNLILVSKNVDGQHIGETYDHGVLTQVEIYDASWSLVSRDSFDASGNLTQRQIDNVDGTHEISTFNSATGVVQSATDYSSTWATTESTSYDSAGIPTQQITYDLDGSRTIVTYKIGSDAPSQSQYLAADGKLASLTVYTDGGQTTTTYTSPGSSLPASQVVIEGGSVVASKQYGYDSKGMIASVEHVDAAGNRTIETYDEGHQAHPVSITAYDAAWNLLTVTYLDDQGLTSAINVAGDNGLNTITSFSPGTEDVSKVEVYVDWQMQSRTSYDADGKITSIQTDHSDGTYDIQAFSADHQDHATSTSLYDASWQLVSVTYFDDDGDRTAINVAGDDGMNTVTSFAPGTDHVEKVEIYNNWQLQSRANYDADGNVTSIQKDQSDGSHELVAFTPDEPGHASSASLYDASWNLVAFTSFDGHTTGSADALSFLVSDAALVSANLGSWAAASATTAHSAAAIPIDTGLADTDSTTLFSDQQTDQGDTILSLDNHNLNVSQDITVVAPHYDLL